jgi:uncharacterized delta-60 repeat protein
MDFGFRKMRWLSLPVLLASLWVGPGSLAASAGGHLSKTHEHTTSRAAHLDPTFGEAGRTTLSLQGAEGDVIPILMDDDSLIISVGHGLKRLGPDGQLDESFGQGGTLTPPAPPDGNFEIDGLAVDSKGRLIVAGTSQLPKEEVPSPVVIGNGTSESPQAARIMRYLPNGTLDPSFGNSGTVETNFNLPAPHDGDGKQILAKSWVEVTGVAVDSRDRVLLSGGASAGVEFGCAHDWFFNTLTYAAFVARLTETGALDSGFSGDGIFGGLSTSENPLHAEVGADPEIGPGDEVVYASGRAHCPRGGGSAGLAKLSAAGQPSSFGTGGAVRRWSSEAAVEPDGTITTLGYISPWYFTKEPARMRVTRLTPNGQPDRSYGRGGHTVLTTPGGASSQLNTMATDPHGRLLLGGTMISAKTFRDPTGQAKKRHRRSFVLIRLGAHGRLDRSFGPHGRIATRFRRQGVNESGLLLDTQGRAIMVGTYGPWNNRGLAVARYVIDR